MSSIDNVVIVQIDRQTKLPTSAGFGVPAILDINTWQSNDVGIYTSLDSLVSAGATESDEAYKAASALLSQNPRPTSIKVLKRASNVAQVINIALGGSDDGTYTVNVNGTEYSFVASSVSEADIVDGLVAAINGGSEPLTLTDNGTDFDLTANVAGVPFSVSLVANPNDNITLTTTTENVGATSELARLRQIDDDWYFLISTDRNTTFIEQLSSYIETQIKLYGFDTDNADSKNLAPATDTTSLFATIQAANRDRTFYVWSATANLDTYPVAAWIGKMAPKNPGSATWKFKQVSGPVADTLTDTERSNILAKNGNIYTVIGGLSIFEEGLVASGEFIDIIRGTDLIQARIQENIYSLYVTEDKIPFDQGGIEVHRLKVEEILFNVGVGNTILRGGDDAPVVDELNLNDISSADRAARYLNEITFSAFYAGAVHKSKISGSISI